MHVDRINCIQAYFTHHKIHPFQVNNSMIFFLVNFQVVHHHKSVLEHFLSPNKIPHVVRSVYLKKKMNFFLRPEGTVLVNREWEITPLLHPITHLFIQTPGLCSSKWMSSCMDSPSLPFFCTDLTVWNDCAAVLLF